MRSRGRSLLALALLAAATSRRVDLDIFLPGVLGDTSRCHKRPAGSFVQDTDDECGTRVAATDDGRTPIATWCANCNNFLFVRTDEQPGVVTKDTLTDVRTARSTSLMVNADPTDRHENDPLHTLCDHVAVYSTVFADGEQRRMLNDNIDRFALNNAATLNSGDAGNKLVVTPFAIREARADSATAQRPLPRLRVAIVPIITEKMWTPLGKCTSMATSAIQSTLGSSAYDEATGNRIATGEDRIDGKCFHTNVTLTRAEPYYFMVNVSTEPRLETNYPEVTRSCHYADVLARSGFQVTAEGGAVRVPGGALAS